MQHIDDNFIVTYNLNGMKMLPKFMGLVFLRIKYRDSELHPTFADNGTGHYVAVFNKCRAGP